MNSAQTGMCFRLGFFSYLYLFLSNIDVGAIYMYYWRILLLLLVFMLPIRLPLVQAAAANQADLYFLSALVSMASYSDELDLTARDWLEGAGWTFESYETVSPAAEGRFHLVHRVLSSGSKMYVLAFPGTERLNDAKVDLRLSRVPFGGSTPAEFQKFAGLQDIPVGTPRVHRGFNDYTSAALFQEPLKAFGGQTAGERIAQELKLHPEERLYLTGHSLGGAAATLAAARLADMGVAPDQLQVVTFGAPAVGDKSFARHYHSRMNLTRIVIDGDPVKSVLQSMSGRFAQFGATVKWTENRNSERFAHDMTVYLDQALRNYYDTKNVAQSKNTELLTGNVKKKMAGIYVAPFAIQLDSHIESDLPYMKASLKEALATGYTNIAFAPATAASDTIDDLCHQAASQGLNYLLIERFQGLRIKNESYNFRLQMDEELYDIHGNLITMQSTSTTARNLTPIEGMLYLQYAGSEQRGKYIH